MSRIEQLIDEIGGLRNETTHRSALRILSLLENNKSLFLEKLDADVVNLAIRNFESLCDTPSRDYGTPGYLRDYTKFYESLMFQLSRVL